jgi:hypothetical protein
MIAPSAQRRSAQATSTFCILIFCIIYLQKFAIPLGGVQQVSVLIPVIYWTLFERLRRGAASLQPLRLATFALMITGQVIGLMLSATTFSILSFILVLLIFTPTLFVSTLSDEDWRRLCRFFNGAMILPSVMVFVQLAHQLAFHWATLSMGRFVPSKFLMSGFIYEAPFHWGQPLYRPNGFFMLEPSFSSLLIAVALTLELCLFRRLLFLLLFGAALAANLGGTGYLFIGLALPLVFFSLPQRAKLAAMIVLPILLVLAAMLGGANLLSTRLAELSTPGSSGSGRLVQPVVELLGIVADPMHLVSGIGPGNMTTMASTWPFIKIVAEYGVVSAVFFLIYQTVASARAAMWTIAIPLIVIFNFTGAYLVNPVMSGLMMIFVMGIDRPRSPAPKPALGDL